MTYRTFALLALAPALAVGLVTGCSDDIAETTSGGAAGSTSATSSGTTGSGTTSATSGSGGATTSSATASSGTGGNGTGGEGGGTGAGGSGGFPWEGAIDPSGGPSSERLAPHQLGSSSAPQGFYDYVPAGYPAGVKWPLLIAAHGIGENGNGMDELADVLVTGIPQLIQSDTWPNDRPFVVLMPQHPGGGCPGAGEIQAMIAWGKANYEIDERYVYLTGLSCGAIGAWTYLEQHLDSQIAAMVPVAGNGEPAWNSKGCELGKVAIWGFHGDADDTVGVSGTHIPLDGLAACPEPKMESKKTIYPNIGHYSWQMTYDGSAGHDIYGWMLGFTNEP